MEEIKDILARCRSFLNRCRAEITSTIDNPVLSDWSRINIREFSEFLDSLDIPPNFVHAQGQYISEAKKALFVVESLENEVGSVEADFNLKLAKPEKLLQQSRRAESNCKNLEKNMTTLTCYGDILKNVDKTIRNLLELDQFFPLVRRLCENPESFDSGLRVFRALSNKKEENTLNVYDLFAYANRLETRLDKIELTALPGIVVSNLKNRIDICFSATKEIKNFLDHTASFVGKELNAVKAIDDRLKGYKQDSISLLLKSLKREALATSKAISELRRHGYVLQELNYVALLLQEISAFCTGMKQNVTVKLKEMVSVSNSPLSPSRTASVLAKRFFGGITGLYRMIRMLFLSIAGQPILSEKTLRQYIENSITSSPACKINDEAEQECITTFLEESIAGLSRPFPYEEVMTLLKGAMDEYVLAVGKFVDDCEISVDVEVLPGSSLYVASDGGGNSFTMKIAIKDLMRKIIIRTENLQKHQLADAD